MAGSTIFDNKYIIYKNTSGLKDNIDNNLTDSFKASGVPLSATLTGSFTISQLSKTMSWTGELTLTPKDDCCTYLKCKSGDGSARYFYAKDGKFNLGSSDQIGVAEFGFGIARSDTYIWTLNNSQSSLSNVWHDFIPLPESNTTEQLTDPFYTPWTTSYALVCKISDYRCAEEGLKGWCSKDNFSTKKEGNFTFKNPIQYGWENTGQAWKFGFSNDTYPILLYSNLNTLETTDIYSHTLEIWDNMVIFDGRQYIKQSNDKVVLYYRTPGVLNRTQHIPYNMSMPPDGGYPEQIPGHINETKLTIRGEIWNPATKRVNLLGDTSSITYAKGEITLPPIVAYELSNKTYKFSNTTDPSNLNATTTTNSHYLSIIKHFDDFSIEINPLKNVTDNYTHDPFLSDSIFCFIGDSSAAEKPLSQGFSYELTIKNYESLLGEGELEIQSDNTKRDGQSKLQSGDVECYVSDGNENANVHLKLVGKIDCFNGTISNLNLPMVGEYKDTYPNGKHGYPSMTSYGGFGTTVNLGYYKKLQSKTYGIAVVLWRSPIIPSYGDAEISEKTYFLSGIGNGVVKTISWDTDIDAKGSDYFNVVNIQETGWTANIKSYSVTKTSSNKWKVTVVLEWNGGGPTYSSGTLRFECRRLEG